MPTNRDKMLEQYSQGKEEGRPNVSRTSGLEFHYTKKHLEGLINKTDKVLELGCATGYYAVHYYDKCEQYVGIDIVPLHIEMFNKKIEENNLNNVSCYVADAANLDGIEDNQFDVVLCLGPMYHMPKPKRNQVFSECARVCKDNGILAFSYINKIGVYAGACVMYDKYPNELANVCVLKNGTDDLRPDTFFFTTPEEMNATAQEHGLVKIKNLATDFFVTMNLVDEMTNEQFEVMRPLYDHMVSHESCTGMSNHALLVCRKGEKDKYSNSV